MKDTVRCVARLVHIARVFGRYALARAIPEWVRASPIGRRLPEKPGPERLRVLFEELGGTFLKFGQMLALQPDILSKESCDALLKLLDRIEPFSFSEADRIWGEEIGSAADATFERFEREPIATASVGQVYVAYLDDRKVAVKIQRPNIEIEFANDVRLMVIAMRLIRWLRWKRFYWLLEPTSEFVAWSQEELDYRHEARHSEELRRHARTNPAQHVPRVYREFTTRRTLVVEYLEGVTLLEYLRARERGDEQLTQRLEKNGFVPSRFAANVIGNFLGDAFQHGIYHADLHPANLMILEDNVVGYIDFGITGLMSRYSRRHLLSMTLALARGDIETLTEEYLTITSSDSGSNIGALRDGLRRLSQGWYEHLGDQRRLRVSITRIFDEMLTLSRRTGVLPDRDIVKYIRSTIAIDGLLTRFDPAFDITRHIGKTCAQQLGREARREWLSAERFQSLVSAASRLMVDGPVRAATWVERRSASRPRAPGRPSDRPGTSRRSLYLALAILGVAWLFQGQPGSAELGVNLPTAELLFLAVAGALLARQLASLWRRDTG